MICEHFNFRVLVPLKNNFNQLKSLPEYVFRRVKMSRKMHHRAEDRNVTVSSFQNLPCSHSVTLVPCPSWRDTLVEFQWY